MTVQFPELAAIRLGFGLSPVLPPPADPAAVLADVAATAAAAPSLTTAQAQQMHLHFREIDKKARDAGTPDSPEAKEVRRTMVDRRAMFSRLRMADCATAQVGFGERLVQFWSDHFTVNPQGPGVAPMVVAFVEEAIRPNINGSFLDLLTAAETHPAMLLYLDQTQSVGDRSPFARKAKKPKQVGLNENLAREMMELHTLGVGAGYTQQDVRQLANLLTGLGYVPDDPDQRYFPRRAQPGAETVLGQTFGGGRRDGIDAIHQMFAVLANRPETAKFVARKLAVHFVADEPDDALVSDLAAAWGKNGDLPAVYAVLVSHPQLAQHFRGKVRQPFDYIASGLRALGMDRQSILGLPDQQSRRWFNRAMALMGQPFMNPSGPDGWKEAAEAWINPQLLAQRIDWAMSAPRILLPELPDPRNFMQAALGGTESELLARAVPRAESIRDGLGVVLASNDFNRR
ncbi:DUF1800 domain-containing protein [Paracoccus suum]|uniref:DUF1800 domain-containing protein n=1 Tax=Paracoccus suum TaxID=2259340 RepID=A0A344PGW1_9RHOB|nr:DUF1800 domain-containing protein [Paracoccus suum]AXC48616.1 DUF1800 domain-containing protein [Paracoccus suum]